MNKQGERQEEEKKKSCRKYRKRTSKKVLGKTGRGQEGRL